MCIFIVSYHLTYIIACILTKGSRTLLLKRLTQWHRSEHTRQRESSGSVASWGESQENIPMNVDGNNFSLFDLRNDVQSLNAANLVINTEFKDRYDHHEDYPPVQQRGAYTTGRSILKKNTMSGEYFMQTKPSRLSFSPFNGVKIIPHRYDLHKVSHVLFSDDDDCSSTGYDSF